MQKMKWKMQNTVGEEEEQETKLRGTSREGMGQFWDCAPRKGAGAERNSKRLPASVVLCVVSLKGQSVLRAQHRDLSLPGGSRCYASSAICVARGFEAGARTHIMLDHTPNQCP